MRCFMQLKNLFSDSTKEKNIDGIKNKIIDKLLAVYVIVSFPLLILSLTRTHTTGWTISYTLQLVFIIFFAFIFIFRKKLTFRFKALSTALLILFIFVFSISYFGLLSSGLAYVLLLVVFVTLFLGKKYGYISLGISLVVYIVFAILYSKSIITYSFDTISMLHDVRLWLAIGLTLLVVSYTSIFIVSGLEKALLDLLHKSSQSETDYRLLFDQSSEGIIITNIEGEILLVNENFRKMSGFTNDDIIGKKYLDFVVVEAGKPKPLRYDLLQIGKTLVTERKVHDKQGKIRHVKVKTNMLPDGRFQSLMSDNYQQKLYEEQIEAEKEFGKTLIETLPGIFYVFENYDKLVQWNESLLLASGYSKDEIQKIHPNELFDNGEYENSADTMFKMKKADSAYFRADLITKTGERVPLYNSAINYKRNGKIYLMGMGYDISGLLSAEKALKNSEENFRNIYNNTSDAVFIFNHSFKVLSANERFFALTGLNPDDLKRVNIFDFIFDKSALRKVASEIFRVDKGRVVVAEYLITDVAGRQFPIEVRSRQIDYEGSMAVVTSFNEITARKDFEKQVYSVSVKAEEDERGRIAKDLHDGLGPLLSTCKIYLHNIKNAEYSEREIHSYSKLTELINESLIGVKEISNNLSPHILRNFGLEHALKSFVEKISMYSEMKIETQLMAPNRYDEIIEITLYRIATELLNNTFKHSKADLVKIELFENDEKLYFNYSDNGTGFDYRKIWQEKKGLGLFNIVSRINSVGGKINFDTDLNKGVKVNIETHI